MDVKNWLIRKLENEIENKAGSIDLESVSEEERERLFTKFGEGDYFLTKFLKLAYDKGAPSMFCCSGHGVRSPYVVLKVTDDNIELLRKVGRVLSTRCISTNFINDYSKGIYVDYRGVNTNTNWLSFACQVIEHPELFNDSNPDKYYHEKIYSLHKPFAFELKKKLLNYLRRENDKNLENIKEKDNIKIESKPSWKLSDDELNVKENNIKEYNNNEKKHMMNENDERV